MTVPVAIISGSGGLVGSAAVERFATSGYEVIGLENDSRARFFGPDASTQPVTDELSARHPGFRSLSVDVRDEEAVSRVFGEHRGRIEVVIHAAAQPSHDWAAREPHTDFSINATGTLNLLEATRLQASEATFVFCSTNKVYGDAPNRLPLVELDSRLDLPEEHAYYDGIDTGMSIDRSLHSLFGASKAAADLLVQEYGRYFGLPTVCFRAGCLTGGNHAGARLHGFLAYLVRCAVRDDDYTVYGYGGKQVRDNLHAADLAEAFAAFHASPRPAAVYNIGGGRDLSCSVLEAIERCDALTGRKLRWRLDEQARVGDHRWWISDLSEFRRDYPEWRPRRDLSSMLTEIHEHQRQQSEVPA